MKKIIFIAVFFAAAIPAAQFAAAQTEAYPAKPVRLIVAFPPGGSVDVVARLVAPRLSESLGQPVLIDNRSGASGNIGTELAARARPDGYTLLIHTIPFVANVHLYSPMPYDALNDFVPIALLSSSPSVLVVHPTVPARSVGELLQLAKSKPGALNYSAAGAGTNPHIAGELLNMLGGVDIVAVQYKGGGPALVAVLGGEIGITFPNISEAVPHVNSKRLRALGVTGARRSAALPEVPTIAESGVPGYEFATWHGVLAPRGTPVEIVALLNGKLRAALRTPELSARFAQMGLDVIASSPEEFSAHLKSELEKWGRVIRERRMRVE
ncbi:MAG: tripartite tricarboxylate transporter substrate binding protein [Betaproteobacteria bacterium]|nr:MAG: tripartite tricarboxylate transporter substrate binding protein [Betaproteobacteria bacterium]